MLLKLTDLFPTKWVFTGAGIFTLCIAVILSIGIKDIVIVKKEAGPEALLRSAIQTGTTPLGEHRVDRRRRPNRRLNCL